MASGSVSLWDAAKAANGVASTATHKVFGVTETILAGDALLAKGNQIVAGFGDPRLTAATSDACTDPAACLSSNPLTRKLLRARA